MIDTTRDSAVPSVCLITMGCAKNEVEEEPESESPELSEEAPATPLARFQSLSTSSKLTV